MKGKSVKQIIVKRVLPAVLAASMIATAAEWRNLRLMRAKASTSLPGIENIISSLLGPSGSYNILEIAPGGNGEFGYYVAGQEPVKFENTLKSKTSYEQRNKWANDYLNGLEEKGILSSTADSPLTSLTKENEKLYTEYYPWEELPTGDYSTLSLGRDESMKANGTPVETEGGAFSVDSSSYQFNKTGGEYVQNISFSNPVDSLSYLFNDDSDLDSRKSNYIFYKPVFESVSKKDVNEIDRTNDTSYFHFSAEENLPLYSFDDEGKKIFDQAASEDREFKAGNQYFAIKTITEVETGADIKGSVTNLEKAGWYAAEIDTVKGFTKAPSGQRGYFDLNLSSLRYVGKGNGSYDFTSASADKDGKYQIIYDQIRYKGGYTNNNWFAEKILESSDTSDIDAISSRIKVTVVSPDSVPAVLSSYGLVVISSEGKDIGLTSDAKTTLAAYAKGKGALLIDNRAISDNNFLTSAGVSSDKISGSYPNGYVDKSIYLVKTGKDERKELVTPDLTKKYDDSDYKTSESAFNEVLQSIEEENFLRKQKNRNTTDLLSEDVSMASCIRYIISFNVSDVRNKKTKVRILDIEPDDDSEIAKDRILNENLRKKWFGDSFKSDAITVTTMSTRKLVGKTEDISENYDLVYIGKGTIDNTKYLDKAMDGLYYYNIGDYFYINQANHFSGSLRSVTVGMNTEDFDNWVGDAKYRKSGNDITPKKYKELLSFVKAGHPVIVSDSLIKNSTKLNLGFSEIKLDTSKGAGRLTVTPLVSNYGKDKVEYSYQWYRCEANGGGNFVQGQIRSITSANGDSYILKGNEINSSGKYAYYCQITGVTISGKTYTPDKTVVSRIIVPKITDSSYNATDTNSGSYYIKDDGSKDYPDQIFRYQDHKITPPPYVNNDLSWNNTDKYNYYWQDANDSSTRISGSSADLDDWDNGATIQAFAQEKSTGKIRFASDKWRINKTVTGDSDLKENKDNKVYSASVNIDGTGVTSIDSNHVDHYTRLFSFLSQAISYDNVWQDKAVSPSTVVRYVNISSPEIVLESPPESYTEGTGKDGNLTDDTLTLSFKIVNTTDPSPSTTTYTGTLYIDKDNNGLYTEDELLSDLMIAGGDGSDDTNYIDSMKGGISEDSAPSYSAAVILPDEMVGAVHWKLVVTQNPDAADADTEYMPHASYSRISYKASRNDTRPVINVLQVNSDSQGQLVYNLEEANKENPAEGTKIDSYHKWLTNSTVTDKYKINIITVNASDFNNNRYPDRSTTELERDGETYKIESGQPIDLDAYDMIVLGFSDSYGSLSLESCNKVQDFADSGKSVLFTHDNSSHAYVPKTLDQYSWYYKGDGTYAWGAFFFNITLRALDQMDVYGITDTKLGSGGVAAWNVEDSEGNKITDGFLAEKDPYQKEDYDAKTSLTSDQISKLQAAGYSIAYKPESVDVDDYDPGKVVTVPQTQAYTDGFLYRFGSTKEFHNSDSCIENLKYLKTTSVKQVNKGTITTYPYDLGSGNLNVSTTHCQYSQLNLNSDKIVVWYTLDGSNYKYKEDPVNNYYLFSCGNIFYTGAGHEDNPTEAEAKLFINTMIAAYRQQASKPKAYFTGSATSRKQVSSYLVQTGGKTMSAIDVLRSYIEDFTGNDTSQYTDEDFKGLSPMKDLGMTEADINTAAKAAAIRLAYSMTNDAGNRGTEAINRIENKSYGPWLDSSGNVIDGIKNDTTVQEICAGINTLLIGKKATYNEAVPGLTPDKDSFRDQKYYFTIRDDNTGTKTITPKFYLYSTKPIEGIDKKFTMSEEKADNRTTGYYYDITSYVTEYEPKSDNVTTSFSSNKIYGLKLNEDNPALDQLLKKGTVTIAIEPSVKVKSKNKTMTGQKTKVTINTAGLLSLG